MPPDNPGNIAAGQNVEFPSTMVATTGIVPMSTSQFVLVAPGFYKVDFIATVVGLGQLAVALNGVVDLDTVMGMNTTLFNQSSQVQISGTFIIPTLLPNTVLSIQNPLNEGPVQLAVLSGGTHPVNAHLVITRLA
jgi:hypothetical protein